MNVCIVGQGAIGLLFYAKLSQQNNAIATLSLRASNSRWAQKKHFSFIECNGSRSNISVNNADNKTIKNADIILVCVKSYQVVQAINELHKKLNPNATIILCHNGLGTIEQLQLIQQPILAMLTTHGSKKHQDDLVEHTGLGLLDLGLVSGDISTTLQQTLLKLFSHNFDIHWQQDIKLKQWTKLAINCVINPITSIENIDNGLINQPKFTLEIENILKEVIAVASSQEVKLSLEILLGTIQKVAQDTARNCSSMRSDILAKRQTEIDYINGYIHKLGEENNISTPYNSKLWQQVLSINSNNKP